MTQWIITRHGEPIYASTSWPRFIVMLDTLKHDHPTDTIDWTTTYHRTETPS